MGSSLATVLRLIEVAGVMGIRWNPFKKLRHPEPPPPMAVTVSKDLLLSEGNQLGVRTGGDPSTTLRMTVVGYGWYF